MRPTQYPSPQLMALAGAQGDVVSIEQVQAHGLGRRPLARLVGQGRWLRLDTGLYVTRDQVPSWTGLAWAGLLLGGDRSRLGGRSAGHLHSWNDEPDPIEVLVPWETARRSRGPWRFIRERSGVRSIKTTGHPPRLTPEDTLLDLTLDGDETAAIDIVTRAIQSRRTDPERVLRRLRRRARHPRRRLLERVLADVGDGAESPLELDFLHHVERPHGLPVGRRQKQTVSGRTDVSYEEYATVVELDGRLGHEGMGRFRDMRRDNAAVVRGDAPLRYGWADVHGDPCRSAAQVGSVLAARGWRGMFLRCSRCANAPYLDIG